MIGPVYSCIPYVWRKWIETDGLVVKINEGKKKLRKKLLAKHDLVEIRTDGVYVARQFYLKLFLAEFGIAAKQFNVLFVLFQNTFYRFVLIMSFKIDQEPILK